MSTRPVTQYQKRLAEKLAETLKAPLPTATLRRVHGVVSLPTIRRLLTLTRDAMPDDVPRNVIVQPAYEWLLQGRD